MEGMRQNENNWNSLCAPHKVQVATAGTSGTFTGMDLDSLYVYVCAVESFLLRGAGTAASSTTGLRWPANTPYFFQTGTDGAALRWAAGASTAPSVAKVNG